MPARSTRRSPWRPRALLFGLVSFVNTGPGARTTPPALVAAARRSSDLLRPGGVFSATLLRPLPCGENGGDSGNSAKNVRNQVRQGCCQGRYHPRSQWRVRASLDLPRLPSASRSPIEDLRAKKVPISTYLLFLLNKNYLLLGNLGSSLRSQQRVGKTPAKVSLVRGWLFRSEREIRSGNGLRGAREVTARRSTAHRLTAGAGEEVARIGVALTR